MTISSSVCNNSRVINNIQEKNDLTFIDLLKYLNKRFYGCSKEMKMNIFVNTKLSLESAYHS